MPTYQPPPTAEHDDPASVGILVVNLGTPDAPTTPAVRRFLRQFLSDPRVVELPRLIWWPILNLAILPLRPARSAAAYRKIWTDRGSPLLLYSAQIADGLRRQLGDIPVELGMTYGEPSIGDGINALLRRGVRKIMVLPLYPQYSGTTTGSVFDAVAKALGRLRRVPDLEFISSYHDDAGYIGALANSVREFRRRNGSGDKLLMSFHGVPQRTVDKGDPYYRHCCETAALLAKELDLGDDEWLLSFQSRVGRAEWLRPYTDETIEQLGNAGVARIDAICPGFAADCLETLEEIAMENAENFVAAGGQELRYIPALNARDDHVQALAAMAERYLAGHRNMPVPDESCHAAGGGV